MSTVVTRVPPSPTGSPHVGTIKFALINYLFTKKNNGKIILRWEDTDKARSKKEFEQEMFEAMSWINLKFDEVYHQSERALIYKKYIEKLIAEGFAYLSEERITPTLPDPDSDSEFPESGEAEPATLEMQRVVRFKNPNKVVTFADLIRGEISVDTTELGDFVLARSIEEPLYHVAVVIDDFEMGITHIIRGEDGIYNTPRQILIQEAIGAPRPIYAHLPFILGKDKSKLSKRNGSIPVLEYKKRGILPEALINYLAFLGWNPGNDREIYTLDELIDIFDLNLIQRSGGIFDEEKLIWFNREHIKKLSDTDLKKHMLAFMPQKLQSLPQWSEERFLKLIPDLRERISVFSDLTKLGEEAELDYFFMRPEYDGQKLIPRQASKRGIDKSGDSAHAAMHRLSHVLSLLKQQDEKVFDKEAVKTLIWDYASKEGRSEVLWPLRYALSGKDRSPDPFTLCEILGKEESLERIRLAIEKTKNMHI